jgi:hypothetical protein
MRSKIPIALLGCALVLTGWKAQEAPPAPPKCSAADTRREAVLTSPLTGDPVYIRACGRARATVRVNDGQPYLIRGGFCVPHEKARRSKKSKRRALQGFYIGVLSNPPGEPSGAAAVPFLGSTTPVTRPGRVTIDDSEFEVPGIRVAASGTVTVGRLLRGGTFNLYGRDASGPTGVKVTGSWTCG